MTDVPVVDNKTLGASESPTVVNPVSPDAPQGHASGDAIGDKPTVVQQAPQEPNSSTVPSAAAASEPAPTAAINGQPAASEPSIAGPSSTDARPSDKPATAVSEPPQAASIPAPAEPVQNDISEGAGLAPAPAQDPLAAGANGEPAEKDKDAGAPATSGASPDIKVADAPPATEGVESEPSVGDKRKADELTQPPAPASTVAVEPASNGASATADNEKPESVEPAAKKPKLDETPDSAVKTDADASEAVANGGGPKRGASRGKKDKKPVAPAPVGRTARKTRSQGPIES